MGHFSIPALRVLSVLDSQSEVGRDPLGALKPFFEPIFKDQCGEIFDSATIADHLNDTYFWRIPADVVESMIGRFVEWGWLEQVLNDQNKKAYLVASTIQSAGSDVAHGAVFNDIQNKFTEFVRAKFSERTETPEQLADILIEWLVSVDGFSVDRLTKHISSIRKDETGKFVTEFEEHPSTNSLHPQQIYICARFAKALFDANDPLKDMLSKLAQVGLLTEVVHDFAQPSALTEDVKLTIYLDSPLALDALGMSGDAARESVAIVLDGLRKVGVSVCVLRHSISELQASLRGVISRDIGARVGPTAEALKRGELSQRQVSAVQAGPEPFLKKVGIGVDERTLASYPNTHKYFDRAVYDELYDLYSWQENELAREHDATLVAVIMRRRGELKAHDFLQAGHLAVSRNGSVISQAERLCLEKNLVARGQVPPVIHFRSLSTLAWLKTGLANGEKLSRSMLLASCYRILSLNPKLVDAAIKSAKALASDSVEDLEMLLSIERSSLALSDATYGDAKVLGYKDIREIIHSMNEAVVDQKVSERTAHLEKELADKNQLTEEMQLKMSRTYAEQLREAQAEFNKAQEKGEKALGDFKAQLTDLAAANESQREQNERLAKDLKGADADRMEAVRVLIEEANLSIKYQTYALMILVLGIGGISVWLSLSEERSGWVFWAAVFVSFLSFLIFSLSSLNQFFGVDVSAKRLIEPMSKRRLTQLAKRRGLTRILENYDISFNDNKLSATRKESEIGLVGDGP